MLSIDGTFESLIVSYTAVSMALSLAWIAALGIAASRDKRVIGFGATEYRRVVNSSLMLFAILALIAYLTKIELARGYFITALPVGLLALLITRWIWRRYLVSRRLRGELSARVVLVGSLSSVTHIYAELAGHPQAGYHVVGACVPGGARGEAEFPNQLQILGDVNSVLAVIEEAGCDTVIVTSSDALSPRMLRELSWSLEPGQHHLVMAPALTDIAGPRLHTRPVAGLPLVHVETPRYEGSERAIKRGFDVLAAAALIVVLSPLLVALAIGVRLTSDGPVLFRQLRIGLRGTPFNMLKFRSMVSDADAQLMGLLAAQGTENTPLFKIQDDPRITRLGAVLRRYSLDELPQLFNVLNGSMSLVGPRPQVPGEVELYDNAAKRRLYVKPGITGLWQTSGRSNLSWEESIRLDLYYVENWSLIGDLIILGKTLRAVVGRDGAY